MYICILIYTIISILYNIYIYNYAPLYIDCVYTVGSLCIPYRLFTSIKIIYIPFGWSTCYGSHGHRSEPKHQVNPQLEPKSEARIDWVIAGGVDQDRKKGQFESLRF